MKILSASTATNFSTTSLSENEKFIKQVGERGQRNYSGAQEVEGKAN